MVYAFLIHTATPPGPSRVLYSQVFAAEKLQDDGSEGERLRLLRKERMAAVARQVQAAFQPSSGAGQSAAAFPGAEPTAAADPASSSASTTSEFGALRLAAGDPCDSELTALWLPVPGANAAAPALALTLLCEEHDNLTLAEATLRHLRRALLEHLRPATAPAGAAIEPPAATLGREVLLRADCVDAALASLLPFGQLLFLNHQFVMGAERELAGYINAK